jgi:ribosomal protein S18 acetylase RimI-like enzyme
MGEIIIAKGPQDYKVAAGLFQLYADWLNIDLSFQHFNEEMAQLEIMYGPPSGAIVLYKHESNYEGCVGIRAINNETAELKRMYVIPSQQRKGIGNILLHEALKMAKGMGYKTIRLDTLKTMTSAMNLYKKFGFKEIPAYYFNPNDTAVYFEKSL